MKRFASLAADASLVGRGRLQIPGGSAAASSAAAGLTTLTLAMNGKTITVGGTLQSGAVNAVSTVQGNPAIVRLDPGVSFAQAAGPVISHGGDFDCLDPYGALVFSTTVNRAPATACRRRCSRAIT